MYWGGCSRGAPRVSHRERFHQLLNSSLIHTHAHAHTVAIYRSVNGSVQLLVPAPSLGNSIPSVAFASCTFHGFHLAKILARLIPGDRQVRRQQALISLLSREATRKEKSLKPAVPYTDVCRVQPQQLAEEFFPERFETF